MDADWLPEPEVVPFVKAHAFSGRLITWFGWGEYALWHFEPDLRISMDGRRETIYSNETLNNHLRFYFDQPGGRAYARSLVADFVWLPNALPITSQLPDEGWRRIFSGPVSSVFARSGRPHVVAEIPAAESNRRFPGP
jgi:hypothetical protein